MLEWCRSRHIPCPWDAATCAEAAHGGHLAVLEFAHESTDRHANPRLCPGAQPNGEALRSTGSATSLADGCAWDASTCAAAAAGGHLTVLRYARKRKCPWDARTASNAARGGHLEVLQWARSRQHPCPWNEAACAEAAAGGHLEALRSSRPPSRPPPPTPSRTHAPALQGFQLPPCKPACCYHYRTHYLRACRSDCHMVS